MSPRLSRQGSHPELLLAIESSCDETSAAIVDRDLEIRSNIVASQYDLHGQFGGVVPEIAARGHVRKILPVIDEVLRQAGCSLDQISALAVTSEPGLVGSLLVGVTAAKTLAMVLNVPLVAVNHITAHIYACRMAAGYDVFPAVGLVVSGGHTNLYHFESAIRPVLIGCTIDDAAGEAFDKVARILGLPFPGGPSIDRIARAGDPLAVRLPRTFLHEERLDFSFSGLKTAVLYQVQGVPGSSNTPRPVNEQRRADLAAGFQEAVVDVLVAKCEQALQRFELTRLCVGGGVAANSRLRERLEELAGRTGASVILAPPDLCTDNAAMAAVAWELLDAGLTANLDLDVNPGLVRR